MREVFSQMFTVKLKTNYESKNYHSIDNDEPHKYSITE